MHSECVARIKDVYDKEIDKFIPRQDALSRYGCALFRPKAFAFMMRCCRRLLVAFIVLASVGTIAQVTVLCIKATNAHNSPAVVLTSQTEPFQRCSVFFVTRFTVACSASFYYCVHGNVYTEAGLAYLATSTSQNFTHELVQDLSPWMFLVDPPVRALLFIHYSVFCVLCRANSLDIPIFSTQHSGQCKISRTHRKTRAIKSG